MTERSRVRTIVRVVAKAHATVASCFCARASSAPDKALVPASHDVLIPPHLNRSCPFVAEIVEIELDVLRNNILRFELLLSISGFTVTLGALVTGELAVFGCWG